jgi:putative glutamine amidotransferase
MKRKVVIGITDCSKFANYERWIAIEVVEVLRLSHHENNFNDAEKCDGIILSGGEDVHPRFYHKPEYLPYCHEIDERRDEFEWRVLEITEKKQLPLLGICRGLQVANVFFGGTLIPDIPAFGKFNHSRFPTEDRYHSILVDSTSALSKLVGWDTGEVNSAHHQSAELVAKGLVANAISPDGVIEGIERQEKEGKPFFQLVQWHPERMKDLHNPFSQNVKSGFLEAVKNNRQLTTIDG